MIGAAAAWYWLRSVPVRANFREQADIFRLKHTWMQIPMLFERRQAGGVIGWTAAIAAYGPFVLAGILGSVIGATDSAVAFFWGLSVFFALNTALNWWFYARRNAPYPC